MLVDRLQVHLACPQTLLPVLPLLTHELQVEVEAQRLAAIDLLGKLFTLPGSDMDQEYGYLFEEFLRRSKDQKVELRSLPMDYCCPLEGSGGLGSIVSLPVVGCRHVVLHWHDCLCNLTSLGTPQVTRVHSICEL